MYFLCAHVAGLQLAQSSPEHSVEEDTDSGPTTDPPMDAQMPRHQLQGTVVMSVYFTFIHA